MPIPCNSVHRFSMAGALERRGESNAREFGFGINTRADASSSNPNAGTVEIVDDPLGGDFKTLRLDSDLSGSSWGADLTMDLEWKRPGRADGSGTTNNVQQFSPICVVGHGFIATASFGAASTGYITILNLGTTTGATVREFELRVFRDGSANLVNRTTGPTVSLVAGTIPIGSRFRYYVYYKANTSGTNGVIEFGVSTNGGGSWTTASSTASTITNSPIRRIRLMARAENSQVSLLDSGVPEGCYDWFGVAVPFLGTGSGAYDESTTVAQLRDRATHNPFFGFHTGGVTSDGFTVACVIADDDFDVAGPTIEYEVYDDGGEGSGLMDPIPADPSANNLVASGTLTPDGTFRLATDRVTGLDPYTFYFVRLEVDGVFSHWVRARTAHTAAQGPKLIKLGLEGHIQNTGDKRPCISAGWIAARELDELVCVAKRWHNDNNGDRAPGVTQAKIADLYLNANRDVFVTEMHRNTPAAFLFAEYEGGWTNADSRYAGSGALLATIDGNFNYNNTGSGGDRGDDLTAGDAWTNYLAAVSAIIGPFAVNEPTPGCLYYARTRGRVKFIHLAERIYRNAAGVFLGETQVAWAEAEIADGDFDLVVILSPSSFCDEDATPDDSYGSPAWVAERDDTLARFAAAAMGSRRKLLFLSDCKFTPFLVGDAYRSLAGSNANAIVACAGLGKTAGRVPQNDYDAENFIEDDAVSPKVAKPGILFSYLALGDSDADQNDLTCPISGETTGVAPDDAVTFWGEVWIDEAAKTVRIMGFNGTNGQLLTDSTFGTFDVTLSYGWPGGLASRMLLGLP